MVFQRTKPHFVLIPEEKALPENIVRSGKPEKREYEMTETILMDHECKGVNPELPDSYHH